MVQFTAKTVAKSVDNSLESRTNQLYNPKKSVDNLVEKSLRFSSESWVLLQHYHGCFECV